MNETITKYQDLTNIDRILFIKNNSSGFMVKWVNYDCFTKKPFNHILNHDYIKISKTKLRKYLTENKDTLRLILNNQTEKYGNLG